MSINPETEGIVALPVREDPMAAVAGNGHTAVDLMPIAPPEPLPEAPAKPRRSRPAWAVPVAIAAVGLIASGTLGYLFYTTTQQRDSLHQQLVSTKANLASTQTDLADARSQAASRKVTDDYVAMYVADQGKVLSDYQGEVACTTYSECRTVAQQMLTDMQQFQTDRKAANVPAALASTDANVGDALSAGIAADQEFIAGLDNDDVTKIKDGGNKIDAAMLNIGKAQTELGAELK